MTFKNSGGTTTKTVTYVYDTSDLRVAKQVDSDGNGSVDVTERYVLEDGHVIVQLDGTGSVQHEYMHGPNVDQVFADENALGEVLYPLADNVGTVRDVATHTISTNVTTVPTGNHRTFDSFGLPLATITDGHAFAFTGREYDADVDLQYSRARWFDASVGKFISEDPIGFDAGDANITRYVFNNPNTALDPSGLGFFSDIFSAVGDFFDDIGDFVTDTWDSVAGYVVDSFEFFEDGFERFGHFIEDAAQDTGDFFEEQWENGNIQKALLAASLVATGGAFAGVLAGGATSLFAAASTTVQFASAAVNSYQVFSGDVIGDGTLGRVLGAASAITGGFSNGLPTGGEWFANPANVLGAADGIVRGYEVATGDTIGDGTLGSILNVSHIGVTAGETLIGKDPRLQRLNERAQIAARAKAGLRLTASVGSVVSTGNPQLQDALRGITIASSLWNTYDMARGAYNDFKRHAETIAANRGGGASPVAYWSIPEEPRPASTSDNPYGFKPPGWSSDPSPSEGVWYATPGSDAYGFMPPGWTSDGASPASSWYATPGSNAYGFMPPGWTTDSASESASAELQYMFDGTWNTLFGGRVDIGGIGELPECDAQLPQRDLNDIAQHKLNQLVDFGQYRCMTCHGTGVVQGYTSLSELSEAQQLRAMMFLHMDDVDRAQGVVDNLSIYNLAETGRYVISESRRIAQESIYSFTREQQAQLEQWAADKQMGVAGQGAVALGTGLFVSGGDFVSGAIGVATGSTAGFEAAYDHAMNSYKFGVEHGASPSNKAGLALAEFSGMNGIFDWWEGRNINGQSLSFAEREQRGFDGLQNFINTLDAAAGAHTVVWAGARGLAKLYKPTTLGSSFGNLGVPKSGRSAAKTTTPPSASHNGPLRGEFRGRMINVETRKINVRKGDPGVTGSGIEYAWKNHGGSGANSKSQFSIPKNEVKALLQRKDVVDAPIRQSGTSGNYIREVDAGKTVGNLPVNKGGDATSVITVITDVKGNVVNTFPGALGRSATLK